MVASARGGWLIALSLFATLLISTVQISSIVGSDSVLKYVLPVEWITPMLTVWIWYRPQRISLPLIWLFGFFCDAVFQQPLGLNGAMLVALVFACRQIQVLMVDFDKKFQYAIFLFCLLTVLLIKSAIEGFTTGTELVIWSLGPVLSAVMLTIVLALFRPLWVRIVDE